MTLGLMQPYFFPYLGYIHMISLCDKYIVFDTSQYTPQSWMNRNRILKPHGNSNFWQYITVPIEKVSQKTPLYKVIIKNKLHACKKILKQLEHYKKHAPFFEDVRHIIAQCFENTKTNLLVDLNVQSLKSVCKYLDIKFEPIVFSEEKINLPEITHAGQWALEIATYYKANIYLNPPAGKDIFNAEEFKARGIGLHFMDIPKLHYCCEPYIFEPNLSILDVLMWNSKKDIQDYICS